MLLDPHALEPHAQLDADLCIVGAGAAGITIALQAIGRKARVIVVEGGGADADEQSHDCYDGTSEDEYHHGFEPWRARCLGGATNVWGGWCRPLDAIDFIERDWLPHSGWPFTRDALMPYYERAHAVCKLGPCDYNPRRWKGQDPSLVPPRACDVADTLFHVRPTRFGEEYRRALERASNVHVLLDSTAVRLEMDCSRRTAVRLAAGLRGGKRFSVRAGVYVVAGGGIQTPRLLLASREGSFTGIGNEHDLVGRFFTDHLHVPIACAAGLDGRHGFYTVHRAGGATIRGAISVTDDARHRHRLPGCAFTFHNSDDPHDVLSPSRMPPAYESLGVIVRALRRSRRPPRLLRHLGHVVAGLDTAVPLAYRKVRKPPARRLIVGCRLEQSPNRESRVTLDDSVDPFGVPRARVAWQLTARDRDGIDRARALCCRELGIQSDEPSAAMIGAGAHYMGTTRMHADPLGGVVDEQCRVHGTTNVYIAGSSVFPTAGWVPPTLTIVALGLRLADHLRTTLDALR